jgi:hypothetical protein
VVEILHGTLAAGRQYDVQACTASFVWGNARTDGDSKVLQLAHHACAVYVFNKQLAQYSVASVCSLACRGRVCLLVSQLECCCSRNAYVVVPVATCMMSTQHRLNCLDMQRRRTSCRPPFISPADARSAHVSLFQYNQCNCCHCCCWLLCSLLLDIPGGVSARAAGV